MYIGGWHPRFERFDQCGELRRLRLWSFKPDSGDLTSLAAITRLEEMELTQTTVASLNGVERLEDLRYLKVAYAPRLESLDRLTTGGDGLRELSLAKARKIRSYEPLGTLPRLRRLWLSGCAPMENLSWTSRMDALDFFSFVDTDVLDGDLTPLLELPKLRYAGTMDRRHYNLRFEALNSELRTRRNAPTPAT